MKVQPTDFENASSAAFVKILIKAFAKLDVDLTTPLSGHGESADERSRYDQKFRVPESCQLKIGSKDKEWWYLQSKKRRQRRRVKETSMKLDAYISHLNKIASGKTLTIALKMRCFIENQENYTQLLITIL